jgi:aminoglycoside phosphotransferase (APT) family kinase protein
MHEEPLTGGNTHAAVVKVGATVRRPTGPWTPSVHALLLHLERAGFEHAPRVIGLDEQGRESLTFVEGLVVHPDHDSLTESDGALSEIARVIRSYHDAVSDFVDDEAHVWGENGRDPIGPLEVLCHNDLAPWNLVLGPDGSWTFIDWDLAAPGRRAWDLAWALLGFVSLMPDAALADDDVRRRIGVFRDGYGADLFPMDTLAVAAERCGHEAGRIRDLGASGVDPYVRLLAEGHYETWTRAEEYVNAHIRRWRYP